MKKLNLDSNNITEIKAFAFKGLSDLIEISVQNNPIKILSSFAFAGIRNVSSLMLGHNQLNVIEKSAFAATEMIQMLILNNNPIKVCILIIHTAVCIGSKVYFQIEKLHFTTGRTKFKKNTLITFRLRAG